MACFCGETEGFVNEVWPIVEHQHQAALILCWDDRIDSVMLSCQHVSCKLSYYNSDADQKILSKHCSYHNLVDLTGLRSRSKKILLRVKLENKLEEGIGGNGATLFSQLWWNWKKATEFFIQKKKEGLNVTETIEII